MNSSERLKIAIVGSGAVGSYYGALLAASGQDVHFLMRSDLETVRNDGLKIEKEDGDELHLQPAQVHGTSSEIGRCDLVIVALKATSNESLLDLLPPLLGETTWILTLQNGLGNERFLSRHFGGGRVLGGLCFICLNRVAPGVVKCFAPGYIVIGEREGPPRERTRQLESMWRKAGVKCHLADSLAEARWRKLCWNIPFNGLTIAAGGIDTESVLADAGLREEVFLLMKEVQVIAEAAGSSIEDAFLERQLEVTYPMGPYRPSSLIDYEMGRQVEVEAIWGEPFRQAVGLGVPAPRLQMLYRLLTSLCRRRAS